MRSGVKRCHAPFHTDPAPPSRLDCNPFFQQVYRLAAENATSELGNFYKQRKEEVLRRLLSSKEAVVERGPARGMREKRWEE
jgi:hypothetical protein